MGPSCRAPPTGGSCAGVSGPSRMSATELVGSVLEGSMKRSACAAALLLGLGLLAAPAAHAAAPARPFDFDGNGYRDLAVAAPGLQVGAVQDAGGVVALPASAAGVSRREKVVTQSSRGVPGASESGDLFGASVTSADFDRDGFADLAVGQPGEAVGALAGAGGVTVVYGSPHGLDTRRSAAFSSPSAASANSRFGTALAAGDLDRDGFPDLAVGAPFDDIGQGQDADFHPSGTVTVLHGGPDGIRSTGAVVLHRQGLPDFDVSFGEALAVGDLDLDGGDDLVVGSRGARFTDEGFAGSVSYCPGRAGGPTGCSRLVKSPQYAGLSSLSVGNVSGDARPEVVVGVPNRNEDDHGSVKVLRMRAGSPLAVSRELTLTQGSAGVPGADEPGDAFGRSVALADIDRGGYADLGVGAPGEEGGRGRVIVIPGARGGYRTTGSFTYSQRSRGIPGAAEAGDAFGTAVTMVDHDRDRRPDLAVGAFGENHSAGAVTLLPGSGTRFATGRSRTLGLATLGYADPASASFGAVLGKVR